MEAVFGEDTVKLGSKDVCLALENPGGDEFGGAVEESSANAREAIEGIAAACIWSCNLETYTCS